MSGEPGPAGPPSPWNPSVPAEPGGAAGRPGPSAQSGRRTRWPSRASPGPTPSRGCRGWPTSVRRGGHRGGIPVRLRRVVPAGARFGPASVRTGSKLLRPYHPGLDVAPWSGHQARRRRDLSANPFDLRQAISEVEAGARALLGAVDYLIAIGGDHTIALPLLRATAGAARPGRAGPLRRAPRHLDTYFGAPYTHGTPFRRAAEEGVLALDCSAHVGIRGSLYASSDLSDDRKLGFATVSTTTSPAAWMTPSTGSASGSVTGRCT